MSTSEIIFGLGFAVILAVTACYTARIPFRIFRRLRSHEIIPSDERKYLQKQARLRLVNSVFMLILGGFLAWTYLSGMERRAGELVQKVDASKQNNTEIPEAEKEIDKAFFKNYFYCWIAIVILLFGIVAIAFIDLMSTRKYAWQQMVLLKDDHKAKLERDLAMYRQQMNDRRRGLNRK